MPDKLYQLYKNYTTDFQATYIKVAKVCGSPCDVSTTMAYTIAPPLWTAGCRLDFVPSCFVVGRTA